MPNPSDILEHLGQVALAVAAIAEILQKLLANP